MIRLLCHKSNFLGIPVTPSTWRRSRVAVLPLPYERTVSYGGGTEKGPSAILKASRFVEFYDEETKRDISAEAGIATLSPLTFGRNTGSRALERIRRKAESVIGSGKLLVGLGGEHTISQALIAAHLRKYPDLSVLQIDAHSDLRDSYQGNRYSHASVMARVCEFLDPAKIVQVGIRAQCAEEADFIRRSRITTLYAHDIRGRRKKDWEARAISTLSRHVYLTFDVDGLDPSIMPATGTPEPNGLQWEETVRFLRRLCRARTVVGFDVVELAPIRGLHHADLTAAKLISKILNYCMR